MLSRVLFLICAGAPAFMAVAVEKRDGGFIQLCQSSWTIWHYPDTPPNEIQMEGACTSGQSRYVNSMFPLNRCYNNMDGVLQPANGNGDFFATCFDCTSPRNPAAPIPGLMTCTCLNRMHENVSASIDLNGHITVTNNILGCTGVEGVQLD
ncbi:hypothetical protein GQ53DRAFT_826108 [Thozetella sp. PMI_491]|nr:hypothetical protein GQ53DRAFT_826108 [Thozetella sp. PMI_491]